MTSGSTIRVGVIGRGFGARVVAPVFAETEGCEVVDVVSPRDAAATRALCARRDVDLIAVHSPPFLHDEHVRWALDAGHAVLCDKPFGRNATEAERMLVAAVQAGAIHLVNFEFRHHPARERLRALVLDGAVGEVEHVQWSAFSAGSRAPLRRYGWLFDAALGGGWVGAWGSHAIDFLRWAFGEIADASAECRTTIAQRPDAEGRLHRCSAEDGFTASLRTTDGVTIAIDTTFVAPVDMLSRITVIGADGVLESVGDHRIVLHTGDGVREELEVDHGSGDPHLLAMRRFAAVVRDCVRRGVVLPGEPTFADGLACARVMDRLRSP